MTPRQLALRARAALRQAANARVKALALQVVGKSAALRRRHTRRPPHRARPVWFRAQGVALRRGHRILGLTDARSSYRIQVDRVDAARALPPAVSGESAR